MRSSVMKASRMTIKEIIEVNGKKGLFYILKFAEIKIPQDYQAFFLFENSQSYHLISSKQFRVGDLVNIEYYIKEGTEYHNITQLSRYVPDGIVPVRKESKEWNP